MGAGDPRRMLHRLHYTKYALEIIISYQYIDYMSRVWIWSALIGETFGN
jgi:hypothetical protein